MKSPSSFPPTRPLAKDRREARRLVIKGIVENNKMKINSASSRAAAMVMHRRVQYAWSCLQYRPEFLLREGKLEEKKLYARMGAENIWPKRILTFVFFKKKFLSSKTAYSVLIKVFFYAFVF